VPAAAVIPAPIKNIEVVAVKKLVVGFLGVFTSLPSWGNSRGAANGAHPFGGTFPPRKGGGRKTDPSL
jgi:hypothetical protein